MRMFITNFKNPRCCWGMTVNGKRELKRSFENKTAQEVIMVYAFMIQTVLPGQCTVLYSNTYIPDPSTDTDIAQEGNNTEVGKSRTLRKERLQSIAEEIQSEYGFRVATSNRSFHTELQTLLSEGTLPDFEIGFFRLSDDTVNIFRSASKEEKIVVWLAALNSGFSLICDTNENRILAESVLKILIKYFQDYCRILGEPNNVLTKSDRVALIENQFLPNGKLLFMNHRVIRQFEKELETKMKSQTWASDSGINFYLYINFHCKKYLFFSRKTTWNLVHCLHYEDWYIFCTFQKYVVNKITTNSNKSNLKLNTCSCAKQ